MENKSFVKQLQALTSYQANNPTEIQEKQYCNKTTNGQKLKNIKISNETFNNCKFTVSTFVGCTFTKCQFFNCDFTGSTMYNVTFSTCKLIRCKFNEINMQDVHAIECVKQGCEFGDIDLSKNNTGFDTKQNNIVSEEDKKISVKQTIKQVMKDSYFKNWTETEEDSYQLTFEQDQNFGIALYSNTQKNSSNTDDYWELTLFVGNESIYMEDFNFNDLSKEDIIKTIKEWIQNLEKNSDIILKRILEILLGE